jgi:hypothetical protein
VTNDRWHKRCGTRSCPHLRLWAHCRRGPDRG